MRVKRFSRVGLTGTYELEHHQQLEDEVNAWLEQNLAIEIVDLKQPASGGSWAKTQFFVTIVYRPNC